MPVLEPKIVMASVSEIPQTTSSAAPPPPSVEPEARRRGRPRNPTPEIPEKEAAAETETPKSGMTFFERLTSMDNAAWERHMVYLYRLKPITDMTSGGVNKKYLCKYTSPFDEDGVMKHYGSGTYRAQLNERVGGKDKMICQHIIEIENPAYPPVIPKGAWVDDPRNKEWDGWFDTPAAAPAAPPSTSSIVGEVMAIIKQLQPEASGAKQHEMVTAVLDAVKETRRELAQQNDPSKMFEGFKTFIPLLVPLLTRLTAPPDNGFAELAKQQSQQIHELRLEMMKQAQHANGLGSIKDVVSTIALLREQFPAAESSSPKWLEMLGPAIQYGMQMFERRGAAPGPAPQPVNFQPSPAVIAQENPAVPSADPAAQTDAPRQYTQEEVAEIQQIVMAAARPMFNFLSNGKDGLAFADYFIEGNSLREWQILKTFGYDNLLLMIQQHKAAWLMLSPMLPQFAQFMSDFYNWTPAIDEDEPPNPDETDAGSPGASTAAAAGAAA